MRLDTVLHGDCISTLLELYSGNGEFADLVVSTTQMVVYVLKGHDFSRAANDLK
jgi:hypothetical protein